MAALDEISDLIPKCPHDSLFDLLIISAKFSITQSKAILLAGYALEHNPNVKALKKYLKYLGLLDSLQIKGLPQMLSEEVLDDFMIKYYENLKSLYDSEIPVNCKERIESCVSKFISHNISDIMTEFSKSLLEKKHYKGRRINHLKGWIKGKFIDFETGKCILNVIESNYLKNRKGSMKYESFHLLNIQLATTALKCQPTLLSESNEIISKIFENVLVIAKKYIIKKHGTEQIFLASLEFVFACLSSPMIGEIGLKNIKLASTINDPFGKMQPLENYFWYFFNCAHSTLSRPSLAAKIACLAKEYLSAYLIQNSQYIFKSLETIQKNINESSESLEIGESLTNMMQEILEKYFKKNYGWSESSLILGFLQEHIIPHLDIKQNLDTLVKLLALIQDNELSNTIINQIFSISHQFPHDHIIKVFASLSSCLQESSQVLSIIQFFLTIYQHESIELILTEIIQDLQEIALKFPNLVFNSTLNVVVDFLLLFEKQVWIKPPGVEPFETLNQGLLLLQVLKACVINEKISQENLEVGKLREFWCLIYHIQLNYSPKKTSLSKIETNEALKSIAMVTPIIIEGSHKEAVVPASLIYLFDSRSNTAKESYENLRDQVIDVIGNKKQFLSKILNKLDYGNLLIVFVIYKLVDIRATEESIYEICFEYLNKEEILGEATNDLLIVMLRLTIEACFENSIKQKGSIDKERWVAKEVISLLKNSTSPNNLIRELSQQLLFNIVPMSVNRLEISSCYAHLFPYIVEFDKVLETALDLLGCTHNEILKAFTSVSPSITLPHSSTILILPTSQTARQQIFEYLCSFIGDSLGKSFLMGSQGVISAFANYNHTSGMMIKNSTKLSENQYLSSIFGFSILFVNHHYYSYKLFPKCPLPFLSLYEDPLMFHNWYKDHCMEINKPIEFIKSSKAGTPRSHDLVIDDSQLIQMQVNFLSLADSLIATDPDAIKKAYERVILFKENGAPKEENGDTALLSLTDLLGQLAAIIVIKGKNKGSESYLHAFINKHLEEMSVISSTGCVYCSEWLSYAMPNLKPMLFEEIANFWKKTLSKGGIVSSSSSLIPHVKSPFFSSIFANQLDVKLGNLNETSDPHSFSYEQLLEVQKCWIDYVSRNYFPVLFRYQDLAVYLVRIIYDTISVPVNTEALKSAIGTKLILDLFDLAIKISNNLPSTVSFTNKLALQHKALNFLISAFAAPMVWLSVSDSVFLSELMSSFTNAISVINKIEIENALFDEELSNKRLFPNLSFKKLIQRERLDLVARAETINVFLSFKECNMFEKIELASLLVKRQYEMLIVWNIPLKAKSYLPSFTKPIHMSRLLHTAWLISENVAKNYYKSLRGKISTKKMGNLTQDLALLDVKSAETEDECLYLFAECKELPLLIPHLSSASPCARAYAVKHFLRSSERAQLYFMQQIIEAGNPRSYWETYSRVDGHEDTWTLLLQAVAKSTVVMNQLEWLLRVSIFKPVESSKKKKVEEDFFPERTTAMAFHSIIMKDLELDTEKWTVFREEQDFFMRFSMISASLTPGDSQNISKIREGLTELAGDGYDVPPGIYLPTDPSRKVVGIRVDNGIPLQSAKRTPILVTFITADDANSKFERQQSSASQLSNYTKKQSTKNIQCIFKVNDDVRNDQLCLQVIDLMREIFRIENLPIYLRPYKVISTITKFQDQDQLGGILECIPNCKSRDEIGKEGTQSLYAFYLEKFGNESSETFNAARKSFIESMAGYAIACYILQIKDRHNGNILFDEYGHILHIDFGFILSISPGGNMRFERPGFKLTKEMIDIMGNENSEAFDYFRELVIKGYLAVRSHANSFIALIKAMEYSGLTCYRKNAVAGFIKRFYLGVNYATVVNKMQQKIARANNSFFTIWYDRIQLMQQQIEY
ncbi:unnamed protein product [Blepharisma stoltei]|uniref:PI3K/PI4K catalytic domain-containing protein n=1 Tax=Blepharisma stoltei TaxID=1481888 RepID=A0AAU9J9A3_9CILI|nr:unnamed protein product [Blepharisma stoltei]